MFQKNYLFMPPCEPFFIETVSFHTYWLTVNFTFLVDDFCDWTIVTISFFHSEDVYHHHHQLEHDTHLILLLTSCNARHCTITSQKSGGFRFRFFFLICILKNLKSLYLLNLNIDIYYIYIFLTIKIVCTYILMFFPPCVRCIYHRCIKINRDTIIIHKGLPSLIMFFFNSSSLF